MQDAQHISIAPKSEINDHQTIENNYILSVDSSLFTPIYLLHDRAQNYFHKF